MTLLSNGGLAVYTAKLSEFLVGGEGLGSGEREGGMGEWREGGIGEWREGGRDGGVEGGRMGWESGGRG